MRNLKTGASAPTGDITMEAISELFGKTIPAELTCPVHGKYNGWTMVVAGNVIASQCDLCAEKERKAEVERIAEENRIAIQAAKNSTIFKSSCIPPRFTGKSFKDWKVTCREAEEIKAKIGRFIVGFDEALKEGTSFLFTGHSGTGKTHAGCAIGNNLLMRGHSVIYISSLAYVSRVKQAWKHNSEESEDEIVQSFVAPELLIFDEIGKGTMDNKEKGMMHRVLDQRYEQCKPTIGISNLSEQALCKVLEPETVRRLKAGGGEVLEFNWKPYNG